MKIVRSLLAFAATLLCVSPAFPGAADTTVNVGVAAGWNMISRPLLTAETHKDSLFPGSTSNAFYFDVVYVGDNDLQMGKGYWLKFAADGSVPLFGTAVHQDTFDVIAGWNLVGSITRPVDAGSVTTIPGGITLSRFWGYDHGYEHAATIVPGGGYWVKASGAGSIVLDGGAAAAPRALADPLAGLNRLIIEDARGMKQVLRFGEAAAGMEAVDAEMPPAPPPGVFDARFAGGTWVEYYTGGHDRFAAAVSAAAWPVTVRWEISPSDGRALTLNGSIRMTGKGSATIAEEGPIEVTTAGTGVPAVYALRQNYPNPFNPATKISFDLPEKSAVKLTVYDLLGRRVAVLAEGVTEAGTHEVEFDASALPSGLYFYRLDAGTFSDTKKMVLLK